MIVKNEEDVIERCLSSAKDVIDELRENGIKAGLLKPRCFRPLPFTEIPNELKHLKSLAILDKSDSVNGYSGPLFSEITSCSNSSLLDVNSSISFDILVFCIVK